MNKLEQYNFQEALYKLKDLDLLEIPIEGVAAYWLSLKKVLKSKKNAKMLQEEAKNTTEPYIRHLLELVSSSFDDNQIRRFGEIKKNTIIKDLQRKMILISIGLLGMSANENPQQVLIRIISKFPISPVVEKQIFQEAQNYLEKSDAGKFYVDIDHRMHIETLITHLIFYCMYSRRKGKESCKDFIQSIRSLYFSEGMNLILDGFDQDFIKYRLNLQQDEILYETERKMDMSMDMSLGLKNNVSYEDLFKIANSYLL